MSNKKAKQSGKRRRERNRMRAERRCERCGTPLPVGRDYCDHCARLRQVEEEHPDHPRHNDFRARPGVTNDQLRDGFPRP